MDEQCQRRLRHSRPRHARGGHHRRQREGIHHGDERLGFDYHQPARADRLTLSISRHGAGGEVVLGQFLWLQLAAAGGRQLFAGDAGQDERPDLEQQLELHRRGRLRFGGGELRRGGARRAADGDGAAAGAVRVRGGQFRRRQRLRFGWQFGLRPVAGHGQERHHGRRAGTIPQHHQHLPAVEFHQPDGGLGAGNGLGIAVGFVFVARQRGRADGRPLRTIQAGRGRAGDFRDFDALDHLGHQFLF